jgi:hypothetical protein
MKLVNAACGPVMVRNIDTAREKDSMSVIPLSNEKAYRKWLYAVGECGLALCSGVPIMQAMYRCYMRNGKPSNMGNSVAMQSGARILALGLESKTCKVSDQARCDVMGAWKYTPDEQIEMEKYYDSLVLNYSVRPVDNLLELSNATL